MHTCKLDDARSWSQCKACAHDRFLQSIQAQEFSYEEEERKATAQEMIREIEKARDKENEAQDLRNLRELSRKIL